MPNEKALVIGGGISGITVALELARVGIPTTVVERESSIGGFPASFSRKASASCSKCFGCVVVSEVEDEPPVSLIARAGLAPRPRGE